MKALLILLTAGVFYFTTASNKYVVNHHKSITDTAFVNAEPKNGDADFYRQMRREIDSYLTHVTLPNDRMELNGEVDKTGHIIKLKAENTSSSKAVEQGVINGLAGIRPLTPATANGKPTTQKIHFSVTFSDGGYWVKYKLLRL